MYILKTCVYMCGVCVCGVCVWVCCVFVCGGVVCVWCSMYVVLKQCETMLEEYEEIVENWYFHHQEERLDRFFCANHVLSDSDQGRNTLSLSIHEHTVS